MATQSSNPVVKGTWRPTVELGPLLSEAKARKMIRGAQTGTVGLGLAGVSKIAQLRRELRRELRYFVYLRESLNMRGKSTVSLLSTSPSG